jgi:hypothetical protein
LIVLGRQRSFIISKKCSSVIHIKIINCLALAQNNTLTTIQSFNQFKAVYSESGKDSGSIIRKSRLTNQMLAVSKTLVQEMILAVYSDNSSQQTK